MDRKPLHARLRNELPDQSRIWIRSAAIVVTAAYGVAALTAALSEPAAPWYRRTELVPCGTGLIALWLLSRARQQTATLLVIAAVWLEAHWTLVLSARGVRDAAGLPLVALVVGTVLFVGMRAAVALAGFTAITVPVAVALGHWLGFGPGIPSRDLHYASVLLLATTGCLALLRLYAGSLEILLQRSQTNERRLQDIVQGSPDAMIGVDALGNVDSFNRAAERLLGVPSKDALGKRYTDLPLLVPPGRNPGEEGSGPKELLASKAGRTLEALLRDTACDDGTSGTLVVLRDITQRKRAELRAQELQQQLLHAQRLEAVGLLAGGVAHDFNNLLTAVGGYGSLIAACSDPVARGMGRELITVQERGAALTRQLLAFARKEVSQPRSTDLAQVIAEARLLLLRLLGERIELAMSVAQPCPVFADPAQLEQVLLNLVTNARQAMPNGGRVSIGCQSRGNSVELWVSDTGPGIPLEHHERVFEPFFTTKPRGQGTGLGLAAVRAIMDESGGRITLESEMGHGATFRLYWPRSQSVPERLVSEPSVNTIFQGHGEVLIVDDDSQARNVFQRALEGAGYRVQAAASAEEALGHAEARVPDLLLADVMLPGMTGVDLALTLRAHHPTLPVLFVSGYLHNVLDRAPFDATSDLLPKPFTAQTLLRRVGEKLGTGRAEERNR